MYTISSLKYKRELERFPLAMMTSTVYEVHRNNRRKSCSPNWLLSLSQLSAGAMEALSHVSAAGGELIAIIVSVGVRRASSPVQPGTSVRQWREVFSWRPVPCLLTTSVDHASQPTNKMIASYVVKREKRDASISHVCGALARCCS